MKYVIGIDEVGRGPIAGPVAVGIFLLCEPTSVTGKKALQKIFKGVKESKQLSEKKREEWFVHIETAQVKGHIDFAVEFESEKSIDKNGISFCIKKCLERGLEKILTNPKRGFPSDFHHDNFLVLLDGGLKAPEHFTHQKTIIKGDVKEPVIALASICAKVLRDRKMCLYAKKYPEYGFDIHKGYGTAAHYKAIKKHGISTLHRKSFLKGLKKA